MRRPRAGCSPGCIGRASEPEYKDGYKKTTRIGECGMQKEFCGSRREVRCAMRGRALARGFQIVCPGTMPRRTRIGGVPLLYCCAIPEYYVHLDITTRDHLTGTAMLRLRHTRMYRDGYRRCWIPVARRVLSRTLEGLRDIDAMYTDAWRQQVTTTTPDGALRVLGIVIGIDVPMRSRPASANPDIAYV